MPAGTALVPDKTSHPYLRIVDFRDGGIDESALMYVPAEVFPAISRYTISPNDIYVSIVGTIGLVGQVPPHLDGANLTENAAKVTDLQSHVSPEYLRYYLQSPEGQNQIRAKTVGSTQPKLALFRIEEIEVPIPSLSEQREITSLLRLLEARLALLRQTNATLESIAQALFKSWFIDFDPVRTKAEGREPEGMDAATAALFPAEFEESALGLIPKGWGVGRLGNIIELAYGKALKATDRRHGCVPVYGSGGITGYHDEALVEHASIVVGRKGTVGALYWEDAPFFAIDTTFYVKPKTAPLTFCYYAMQQLGLEHMNTDAAVPGLNRENAYRLDVLRPAGEVLKAFDNLVGPLRAAMRTNGLRADTLAQLRDSLLPRLISGKLRIPEAQARLEEAIA